jgi:hypothetical protein
MLRPPRVRLLALASLLVVGGLAPICPGDGLRIVDPQAQQLSLVGNVTARIDLPVGYSNLAVELDGGDVSGLFTVNGGFAEGTLAVGSAGPHTLHASVDTPEGSQHDHVDFETLAQPVSADCELLNGTECLYPYPSDHFRKQNGDGVYQITLPQEGIPSQVAGPIPASIFLVRDGFNPTAQVLMNFPAGVDLEGSGLARLLPEANRSTDLTSLSPDSPTVLLEMGPYGTFERVLHWTENDARANSPDRQTFYLRAARSLLPGHRYIVAVRNLVDDNGAAIEPEPAFRALRDGTPSTIDQVEERREHFELLFRNLRKAGVDRDDLVLAFDFTVASDYNLTGQMVSMRDQGYDWLATQAPGAGVVVDETRSEEFDCSVEGQHIWREVRGTYPVPLFLDKDPETPYPPDPGLRGFDASFLVLDPADDFTPVFTTTTNAEFGISIPCAALDAPVSAMVIGHGLFGNGPRFALDWNRALANANADFGIAAPAKITGGTHWRGMSDPDFAGTTSPSFIVTSVVIQLYNIPALPHRLMQGVLNQTILARMMKQGLFNTNPWFQAPVEDGGHGVFAAGGDMPYFGISLGGIMGTFFAAVTDDVERFNVDVPAMNFSLLLQRATPFIGFDLLLDLSLLNSDSITKALGIGLIEELWTTGEPSGYATHVTENPLPGTSAKKILMTQAYLDQQVSNQATEIAARTLKLPQLVGSFLPGLPLIDDVAGPLPSAYMVYDTGSLDPTDATRANLIPPLANLPATPSGCDPHARRVTIPASFMQLAQFLQPGGQIENFCDGLCDADTSALDTGPIGTYKLELPGGDGSDCPPAPLVP